MQDRIKQIAQIWRSDYQYSTIFSSTVSVFIKLSFAVFNGVLGIVYRSLWNGSICIYYFLLVLVRAILVKEQKNEQSIKPESVFEHRKMVFIITHLMLLLMDISLIVPIAVTVKGEHSYTYGLIPAIAMAAYTIYRITMGIIHFRKSRKSDNILIFELRMINLTDALLALLTVQNALIITNGGMDDGMTTLSAWTSAGIFATIIIITVRSFLKIKKLP